MTIMLSACTDASPACLDLHFMTISTIKGGKFINAGTPIEESLPMMCYDR